MRAAALLVLLGCATQVREAKAVEPNPVRALGSAEILPISQTLHIFTRDIAIPRSWQLRSSASFAVVTRERLRFHLSVTRWDERDADTRNWKVWLEDDTGRRLAPSSREMAKMDRLVLPWIWRWKNHVSQWVEKWHVNPGWDAYQGRADFVFHAPGLMQRDRTRLVFVAEKDGYQMRFTWSFDQGDLVQVHHYGRTRVDEEMGYLIAPSADSQVAQTWYEGEEP